MSTSAPGVPQMAAMIAPPEFAGKRDQWELWSTRYGAYLRLYFKVDLDEPEKVSDAEWKIIRDQLILILDRKTYKMVKGEASGKAMWEKLQSKFRARTLHQMGMLRQRMDGFSLRTHAEMESYLGTMSEIFLQMKENGMELNAAERILALLRGIGEEYDQLREEMEEGVKASDEQGNEALLERLMARLKSRARVLAGRGATVTVSGNSVTVTDVKKRARGRRRGGRGNEPAGGRACYECGSPDHMRNQCPQRMQKAAAQSHRNAAARSGQQSQHGRGPPTCYLCNQLGHVVRYCPMNPNRGAPASTSAQAAPSFQSTEQKPPLQWASRPYFNGIRGAISLEFCGQASKFCKTCIQMLHLSCREQRNGKSRKLQDLAKGTVPNGENLGIFREKNFPQTFLEDFYYFRSLSLF